jgi:hypothetical protein
MNCLKRAPAVACGAALLIACGVADAAASVARGGNGAHIDAVQRRRARRGAKKKKMAERANEGRVAEGTWGGAHLRVNVTGESTLLEFDCAHGEISAPFALDAEGRFDLARTFTREGPGPIRIGREPTAQPARYTGHVEGERLTLSVTLEGADQPLGEYVLTRGTVGRVVKCR